MILRSFVCILVHGFRGVTERLDRIARPLGLRTSNPTVVDHLLRKCILECEYFRIELTIDSGGTVKDARIKHEVDRDSPAVSRIFITLSMNLLFFSFNRNNFCALVGKLYVSCVLISEVF